MKEYQTLLTSLHAYLILKIVYAKYNYANFTHDEIEAQRAARTEPKSPGYLSSRLWISIHMSKAQLSALSLYLAALRVENTITKKLV